MTARKSLGERVYLLLLRLYPEEFRDKYARAMVDFQRDRVRDARASGHTTFLLWVRALADVAVSALAERAITPSTPGPGDVE